MASPFQFQSGPLRSSSATTLSIVSKSANYTAQTSDDLVLADTSGAAWTLALYTAVGNNGRVLRVKKISSDVNALTIDPSGTQTVDGALTTTVNTQYEEMTLVSDGSNWQILDRMVPSVLISWTPTFVGFGSVSNIKAYSKRSNDCLEGFISFTAPTPSGTTASVTLGFNGTNGNVTADANKIVSSATSYMVVGQWARNGATSAQFNYTVLCSASDTTLKLGTETASAGGLTPQAGNQLVGAGENISFNFKVPISGWN